MKRLASVGVAGVLIFISMSGPALANKPIRNESSSIETACGVLVRQTIVYDGEKLRERKDGRVLITGVLKVSWTNLTTLVTVTGNVSGPATLTFLQDGTTIVDATGRGGGINLDNNLVLAAGPGQLVIHADGSMVVPDFAPHHFDLCPALTS